MLNSFNCRLLLIICSSLLVNSCAKTNNIIINNSNNNTVLNGTGNIYIAGDDGTNPILWKNGVEEILSPTLGSANKVVIWGNDLYVAGTCDISAGSISSPGGPGGQYAYWKNGIQNDMGSPRLLVGALSISASGNDLYYSDAYQLWKNGMNISLQGQGSGLISCITSIGTDVYFAGSDSVGDAVYWKNGELHVVAQGYYPTYSSGSDPSVYCMFVLGNDIYIGGVSSNDRAVYWKNGVATYLQTAANGSSFTNVRSIFVSGNDVYGTGNLVDPADGGINVPAYWKNGKEIDLPLNGAKYGNPTSIFVSGSDVYVSGYTSDGAVYWKNGKETILATNGSANSILVQ